MAATHADNHELVDRCLEFLRRYYADDIGELVQHFPTPRKSLVIDYDDLYRYDAAIAEDLLTAPELILEYLEESLRLYDLPVDVDLGQAHIRVANLPEDARRFPDKFRTKDTQAYREAVGIVSETAKVEPKVLEAAWECARCGALTYIPQGGSDIFEPPECQGCQRQGPFQLNKDESSFVDFQELRLQKPPEETDGKQGEHIDVTLTDDIAGDLTPGDRVRIAGIVDLLEGTDSPIFEQYLRGQAYEREDSDFEQMDISEFEERVQTLAAGEEGDPYDLLIESFAPGHYGDEELKEGLILQLFGGVQATEMDGSHIRGDLHMLLLGDPGKGKSRLLQAVEEVAPRSVSAGESSSKAGLTAAAVRTEFGNQEWTLQAGTLVLGNGGIATVDELDKIAEETRESIHEAMEQQRVSVSKAGINATLPARTSVLAAGNPKYGRFDQYESLAEQIELDPALISRFDLLFMVTDQPDVDQDTKIGQHMMETKRRAVERQHTNHPADETAAVPVDQDVFRAWIALAKQTCFPVLTDAAMNRAVEFYANLRAKGVDEDSPVPVTARKLKAITRLAEASARIRLSDTATVEDVDRAKRLVLSTLEDVGIDPETGEFDADIIETGTSKSQRDRIKFVKDTIRKQDEGDGVTLPVLRGMADVDGFNPDKIESDVAKLKDKGEVYEHPANEGHYCLSES